MWPSMRTATRGRLRRTDGWGSAPCHLQRLPHRLRTRQHVRDGQCVQHLRHRVAHLGHGQPHGAGLDVLAVTARLISGAAGAADRRQRPVEGADHIADLDRGGLAGQRIAAAGTFLAVNEAGIAQVAQDGVEKLLWNIVGLRNVAGLGGLTRRQRGKMHQRLQSVFSLCREHAVESSFTPCVAGVLEKICRRRVIY